MSQDAQVYTIGHSTRSLEELIEALLAHGVRTLVDIRTAPSSRHVPQFNREVLAEKLPAAGIAYAHMKTLGGWRTGSRAGLAQRGLAEPWIPRLRGLHADGGVRGGPWGATWHRP